MLSLPKKHNKRCALKDKGMASSRNVLKMNDTTSLRYLNKWDEEHLYPLKQMKSMKIVERLSSLFGSSSLDKLRLNNQIVNKMVTIKEFQENKSVQDLRKCLQQEASNVIAKNLKIGHKHFDYEVFRDNSAQITPEEAPKCLTSLNELHRVGNELQVRKKLILRNRDSKYIDHIKENEEIKVNSHFLKANNLAIEGNYHMVLSNEYYKTIVRNKKKLEKTYQQELIDIINKLQLKHQQMKDIQKEQVALHELNEAKRMRYLESKEAGNIIEKEYVKQATPQAKGIPWVKLQSLNNQLSVIEKEYLDLHIKTQHRLEEMSSRLRELKTEIASLNQYKDHNLTSLSDYYLEILSKGIDVREGGLMWVIVRLTELNIHLTQKSFPDFLDYVSIKYLMEYSSKAIQLKQLKLIMRLLTIKFKKEFSVQKSQKNHCEMLKEEKEDMPNWTKMHFGKKMYRLERDLPAHTLIKAKERESKELKMRKSQVRFGFEEMGFPNGEKTDRANEEELKKTIEADVNEDSTKLSLQSINEVTDLRNMIIRLENEMASMKGEYLKYFKGKYESIKQKGISECVRYDLMFSALFGNYAIV